MKRHYMLPFRRCIKDTSFRHPCWSAYAVLDQLRALHSGLPLAPTLYLPKTGPPVWERVNSKSPYLVPVITPGHIQLIGIQHTSSRSIYVGQFGSRIEEGLLRMALLAYLPWVRSIHIGHQYDIPTVALEGMCVPMLTYAILNVDTTKPFAVAFRDLYEKARAIPLRKQYDCIMDAWQAVVRP